MKEYRKGDVTILWQPKKCIHSGVCVRGLPHVFKPQERPWIQPDSASEEALMTQVLKCPSGALSLKEPEGGENSEEMADVTFREDGPILISGNFNMTYHGKSTSFENDKVVLCRCGASSRKPFCDGSHVGIKFKD
jgi:uncharacterized Fe-S cluster protein YjdI